MNARSFWARLKAQRPAYAFTILVTLAVGILIGTYSSIAIAAPMLVAYQEWRAGSGKAAALPAAKRSRV